MRWGKGKINWDHFNHGTHHHHFDSFNAHFSYSIFISVSGDQVYEEFEHVRRMLDPIGRRARKIKFRLFFKEEKLR